MRARFLLSLCLLGAGACVGDADLGSEESDLTQRSCRMADGQSYVDPDEPNDHEASALRLTSSDDCDGHGSGFEGVLAGQGDVDWFYFEGYDVAYCIVNPTVTVSDPSVRACAYFECLEGELSLSCPAGTTADTSEGGRLGCCGKGSFTVKNLGCSTTTAEDIDVWLRLDKPGHTGDSCLSYQFDYHY